MGEIEWYLPISQAAEMLGCHRRDIVRLLQSGHISFIQLPGGAIKISERSIWRHMRFSDDYVFNGVYSAGQGSPR